MIRLTPLALARGLLIFLTAVNLYRAATQSITADEAFTFNRSVMVPIPTLWQNFDANDHVLHTLLCKASVRLFGVSEFTLRIPSLLGGALFFWMAYRLCLFIFGAGWYMLGALAVITLNPLILDYCSIARGYGLATALLLTSLDQLLRYLPAPFPSWRLAAAGIALALGVAANLTVVAPGLVIVAVFSLIHLGEPALQRNWPRVRYRLDNILDRMVVPGATLSVALLLIPLLPAKRENFYVGSQSLADTVISFVFACFWRPGNLLEHTPLHHWVEDSALAAAPWLLLTLLAVSLLISILRPQDRNRLVLTLLCTGSIALLWILHHAGGMLYPERRTGLYLVPLLTLLAAVILRPLGRWSLIPAGILLAQFLVSWNVRFYDEWLFDAGNRNMALYLREHAPPPGQRLRLGGSFPMHQSAIFYKTIYKLDWLDIPNTGNVDDKYDIYFLGPNDWHLTEKLGLTVRYRHPLSQMEIATPPSSPLTP